MVMLFHHLVPRITRTASASELVKLRIPPKPVTVDASQIGHQPCECSGGMQLMHLGLFGRTSRQGNQELASSLSSTALC